MSSVRGTLRCLWLLGLALPGCALHLRAPEPDPIDARPVAPAAELSHLAGVAHVPLDALRALADEATLEPVRRSGRMAFASWSLEVARSGPATARTEGDELCVAVPFRGRGVLEAVTRLERELGAFVDVCARPRLDAAGVLRLQTPAMRVRLDRAELGGSSRVLVDALVERLEQVTGRDLAARLATLALPVGDVLQPLTAALVRPIALPDGTCVKLRPRAMHLAQPVVTTTGMRLAASIAAQPTVERPCNAESFAAARLPLVIDADLQHPPMTLVLPIGIGLDSVRDEILARLRQNGPITWKNGRIEITALRLESSGGVLLARAEVRGRVRDRFLGVSFSRPIDGSVALWGAPVIDADEIRLNDVRLDLETADRVTGLVAALENAKLTAIVAEHLRFPRAAIEAQAHAALAAFAKGQTLGGRPLPVRIDTRRLAVEQVRAAAQRLNVLVRFEGYVVLGDPGRP